MHRVPICFTAHHESNTKQGALKGILCVMSEELFLTTRLKSSLFFPSPPKDKNDSFTFQMRYRYRLLPISFRFVMKPSIDCFWTNKNDMLLNRSTVMFVRLQLHWISKR